MNSEQLRAMQSPLKKQYRDQPETARRTLRAEGIVAGDGIACQVQTFAGNVSTGLHPATGGDGSKACSGDMLLEALVGCAGVTLRAVAAALDIEIRNATIIAEADLDFRGTLGVSKDVPVGLEAIRLKFDLQTDADDEQIKTLLRLTERYCVVFQTLNSPPTISVTHTR